MKCNPASQTSDGVTFVELMITMATLAVLAGLLLPALTRPRVNSSRVSCVSNLKQMALGFRLWSNDNGDVFPFKTPAAVEDQKTGGTSDLIGNGQVWRHFAALSNEIHTPRMLVCPSDKARVRVTDWASFVSNSQISYFLGLDADEAKPQTILIGDRNVQTTIEPVTRMARLRVELPVEWTREIHPLQGNIGLGDGSAQQVNTAGLRKQVQAALLSIEQPALRLLIP